MLIWIIFSVSVIVAAIVIYFLLRDVNSHKVIGRLPSDNNDTTPSNPSLPPDYIVSPNPPVISPIIPIHNIPGSIVTASSYQGNLVPEKGRMNSNNYNYWQPANNDTDPWIQFTFPDRYEFSSIQIKYNSSLAYKLNTVDILFARDDEGRFWEEPIRIHDPSYNKNAEINHTFNPMMKSKIIRIKIIYGISLVFDSVITSTRSIPIKVGLYGRLVE